jgi:hypothetical protein
VISARPPMAYYGGNLPIEERYYFSPKYHSSHGGLEWQDSHIPIVVAHRAYSGEALRDELQAVLSDEPSALDFAPLIKHLLGNSNS